MNLFEGERYKMNKQRRQTALLLVIALMVTVFLSACGSSDSKTNNSGTSGNNSSTNGSTNGNTNGSGTGNSNDKPDPGTTPPAEQVTVEFWHAFGEGEEAVLLNEVLPKFHEAHPEIKINPTRMPTENLEQQVITAVAGKVAPDIMRMDNTWIAKFAKEGALQPVDGFPGFGDLKAASFDAPVSTNFYDGQYYGVPLDTNTKIAIYNKELLAEAGATEPPATIEELVELARVMKANGKFGITIGGVDAWNMPPWFWTLGGRITDDNYTQASGYLNSPESIQALETMLGWHAEGLLAPPILAGQPGTWEGLRGEEGTPASYLMINEGPWFFGILGDSVKDSMIPAKMPNGPDGKSHSVIGGQNLVLFKGAKHPDQAWTFAQFMSSEEIQVLMAIKTGAIPTNVQAAKSEALNEVYYLKHYVAELETALARTPSAQWDRISQAFQDAMESAFRGQASAKDALDKAAAEIDGFLQR